MRFCNKMVSNSLNLSVLKRFVTTAYLHSISLLVANEEKHVQFLVAT